MTLTNKGIVLPPLDLAVLAKLIDSSTWIGKAVRVIARDVVSHGWRLEADFKEEEKPPEADAQYEQLFTYLNRGACIERGKRSFRCSRRH